MSQIPSSSSESSVPYPPRFWWLGRLSLAGAALVAGLLGLRLWWGQHAGGLLAAEHGRMRARGHPVVAEDPNGPPVPAARNAAAFIQQAMRVQRPGLSPASSALVFPEYPPYPPQWHKMADAAVAANGPVFPLLRGARGQGEADWNMKFRSPLFAILLPTLHSARELSNLTTDAALHAHVRGNDAAALELARDVRHVAWTLDRQPFLVCHLVAIGCDVLAVHRLQVMAPGLHIVPGDDFPVGSAIPDGAATRGQVAALVAELLRYDRSGLVNAMAGERVLGPDAVRWAARDNWALGPLFAAEQRRVLAATERFGAAATQSTLGGVRAALATSAPRPGVNGGVRVANVLSSMLVPSVDRVVEQQLKIEMERRFTAVSLAAQLYRLDHGRWPASLDALVPAYLPAVPADPFAPADGPLRYRLEKGTLPFGADRPIVYSVGDDGADDLASGRLVPEMTPRYGWEKDADQWRDLARWWRLPTLAEARRAVLGREPEIEDEGDAPGPMPEWYGGDSENSEVGEGGDDDDPATRPTTVSAEAVDDKPDVADNPGEDE